MKTVGKMVLTLVALLSIASTASAVDKLIVNNSTGTPVFKVDDAGNVTGPNMVFNNSTKTFGFGTLNPLSALHLTESAPTAGLTRGLTIAQHTTDIAAAVIAINRSRGLEATPSNLQNGDNIAAFHAKPYDATNLSGNWYMPTASFIFGVDGATSNGVAPTAMSFWTGSNAATRLERFRITSDGRLRISNQPAAPASNAPCTVGDMILSPSTGFLYLCTATNSWMRTAFTAY
ncbi:hypothetical protein [Geobacter argillaceus]|uniref:Uncharacterized protein n=1 Tax=Geobacter argillaceus TaxID=345631 RepID=A0A562WRL5_9BACT|nr:hypothetical protein [Geobacter argillaceus]TWJ33052.1 hypothetical protein JN12_00463 [Geobacter argillaceus]